MGQIYPNIPLTPPAHHPKHAQFHAPPPKATKRKATSSKGNKAKKAKPGSIFGPIVAAMGALDDAHNDLGEELDRVRLALNALVDQEREGQFTVSYDVS